MFRLTSLIEFFAVAPSSRTMVIDDDEPTSTISDDTHTALRSGPASTPVPSTTVGSEQASLRDAMRTRNLAGASTLKH